MKAIRLENGGIVIGSGALEHLKTLDYHRCVVVTGGSSMERTGVLSRVRQYLEREGCSVCIHSGVGANPTTEQIEDGLAVLRREEPDLILAVGGGSAIDAAKIMVLFYEYPELSFANVGSVPLPQKRTKTTFVAVPSTSGTGSEVTAAAVYTDTVRKIKIPVKTPAIRPDLAILDPDLPMTMPAALAAETGMDALTHAIEAYVNHGLDPFTEVICRGAIEGLLRWLPAAVNEGTAEAREQVHYLQCMAGISFANVGLGMVHGIAHSFGGKFNIAHGLANAVILPYAMRYNSRDARVREKLERLGCYTGGDVIAQVEELKRVLNIPVCFQSVIPEEDFRSSYEPLVEYALQTGTLANPVPMTYPEMEKMVNAVYYGTPIDW